ncbi:MAG: NnrU family protein [Candidatus Lambdaproteobacteria bacterium]|nr:NnrU family protein [Candidatus Lambdaproteobacteria bacterium]
MTMLILGAILFFGAHTVPMSVPLRVALVGRWGANAYKGVFALCSLAGLVLMGVGFARSEVAVLWVPPAWARSLAPVAMWVAFVLLASAYTPTHIRRTVKHPMMLGVLVWSAMHLLANGERATLWLFAPFAVYAVASIVSAERRGKRLGGGEVAWKFDVMVVAIGSILWGLVWYFHAALFRVSTGW